MATTKDPAAQSRLDRLRKAREKQSGSVVVQPGQAAGADPNAQTRLERLRSFRDKTEGSPITVTPSAPPAQPRNPGLAAPITLSAPPAQPARPSISSIKAEPLGPTELAKQAYYSQQDAERAGAQKLMSGGDPSQADPSALLGALGNIDRNTSPLDAVRNTINGQHSPIRQKVYAELKRRGLPDELIAQVLKQGDDKGFWGKMIGDAPEMAGGMAGAAIGGLTKNPALGATTGAAIGGGLGRLSKEYYNRSARPERTRTGPDLAKDVGLAAAIEGGGEAGGRILFGSLAKAFQPITDDKVLKDAWRLSDELADAGKQIDPDNIPYLAGSGLPKDIGAGFTPAQMTASKTLATVETIAEKSVGGQEIMFMKKGRVQEAAYNQWLENTWDDMTGGLIRGLAPDEVGVVLDVAVHNANSAWRTTATSLYNAVDKTQLVDMRPIKKLAQEVLDNVKGGKALSGVAEKKAAIAEVAGLQDYLDFGLASNVRSDLLDMKAGLEAAGHSKGVRKLGTLAGKVDEAMEGAAKNLSKENYIKWRKANAYYKAGSERFESKLIAKLARDVSENPAAAAKTIFNGDKATSVRKIKRILLGKQGKTAEELADGVQVWHDLRFAWLEDTISKSRDKSGERLIGENFMGKLRTMKHSLPEMFSAAELARIEDIGKMGRAIQIPTHGEGGMLVQILQAGAVGGAIGFDRMGSAAMILGGPAALARVMASDKGSRAIVRGMRELAKTGKVTAGTNGRIIAHMIDVRNQMQKEKEALLLREVTSGRTKASKGKATSRGLGSSLR